MSSFLGEIFKALLGGDQSGRQRSPTLTVEAELVKSNQTPNKPSERSADSPSELLKQATALKRQGNVDEAVLRIDRAIALTQPGGGGRPQAQKKRIYYLLSAKRTEDALKTADQIIAEAPSEARGEKLLVGTRYSFGYQERARVLLAMKKPVEAFKNRIRAAWHWHQAMRLQGRTLDEHTPEKAAEELLEEAARYKLPVSDPGQFKEAVLEGLKGSNPKSMVNSLYRFIQT